MPWRANDFSLTQFLSIILWSLVLCVCVHWLKCDGSQSHPLSGHVAENAQGCLCFLVTSHLRPHPRHTISQFSFFFFLSFCLFRAAYAAYGGSQARGLIGTVTAGLRQSHSSIGSEPHLRPTPQLMARLDPSPTERGARDGTWNLMVPSWIRFHCAKVGTPSQFSKPRFLSVEIDVKNQTASIWCVWTLCY